MTKALAFHGYIFQFIPNFIKLEMDHRKFLVRLLLKHILLKVSKVNTHLAS